MARPTPAHRHAYADLIRGDGRCKAADMHRIVEVMYRLFGTLRDCRLVIAANTRDEGIRVALAADAHEEYGRGDAARSRAFQMRQVLHSLGYAELTPIHLGPKGENVLDALVHYCRVEPPLKAIGCIWIGAERNGAAFLGQLLEPFRKTRALPAAALSMFELGHLECRERKHYLRIAVEPFLVNDDGRRMFHEGVRAGITLLDELWMSMLCDRHPSSRGPNDVS
ncbi:MAG: hypothetical protein ACRD26_23095 [Vicinamibacterales bacterium]